MLCSDHPLFLIVREKTQAPSNEDNSVQYNKLVQFVRNYVFVLKHLQTIAHL